MALYGVSSLVLGLLVRLTEGTAGSFATEAEPVFAVRPDAASQGQCSFQRPLADTRTTYGPLFMQTSSSLSRGSWQDIDPTQHVLVGEGGPAQQRETAPVAPQHPAMPQVGAHTGSQGIYSKPRLLGDMLDFSMKAGWVKWLLPAAAVSIVFAILGYELLGEEPQQQGEEFEFQRRTLSERIRNGPSSFGAVQSLFLFFVSGVVVHATVVIPESYSLAADLGHDASWSGFLIGAAWPLACLSAPLAWHALTVPWSQASIKAMVLVDCAILAVSALVYGFAASPPKNAGLSVSSRTWMLLASRAAMGFAWGTGSPCLRLMAQRVSPTNELLRLNVWYSFFDALGAGVGPFVSSLVCTTLGLQGVGIRSAAPVYCMAGFWTVMMACIFVLLPSKLDDLISTKELLDAQNGTLQVACKEGKVPWSRRLWFLAIAFCLDRILMLSALEAATSLVLENEFLWGRKAIGLMIGATFLVGVPSLAGIEAARRKAKVSDANALLALTVSCSAATLLLFPNVGRLLQQSQQGGALLILFADAVIFPASFLVNGIADGLALQHRIPGTWLSPESMAVARIAIVGILGRPLGPWAARALIASEGRGVYAGGQLALAILLLFGSLEVRRILAEIKNENGD